MSDARIPVTVLTGFLGAGKTTLVNHLLHAPQPGRWAVIENEFGPEGIDNELLVQGGGETVVEMNNGCICCTVRGDLVRILGELAERRAAGLLAFDRVLVETTGLADPAPVAQTFFIDEAVAARYRLDALLTVVDAVHGEAALDEHEEAQEQVGFADRILISKLDLAPPGAEERLRRRLARINPRAPILRVDFGRADAAQVLDLNGFALDEILALEPGFLGELAHEHDDAIEAFGYRAEGDFDGARLQAFFARLVAEQGADLLRYKGVCALAGLGSRLLLQGVHMLMTSDAGRPWGAGEARGSRIVFIGRRLAPDSICAGLDGCRVAS